MTVHVPVLNGVFLVGAAAVSTSDDEIEGLQPYPVHSNHEGPTAPKTPRNQSDGHVQVREERSGRKEKKKGRRADPSKQEQAVCPTERPKASKERSERTSSIKENRKRWRHKYIESRIRRGDPTSARKTKEKPLEMERRDVNREAHGVEETHGRTPVSFQRRRTCHGFDSASRWRSGKRISCAGTWAPRCNSRRRGGGVDPTVRGHSTITMLTAWTP